MSDDQRNLSALLLDIDIETLRGIDMTGATLDQWTAFQRLIETLGTLGDPDYSPAFQDEYQRLWHVAAAERDHLRQVCSPVVERYGAHLVKDGAYYAAAEALGIEAVERA